MLTEFLTINNKFLRNVRPKINCTQSNNVKLNDYVMCLCRVVVLCARLRGIWLKARLVNFNSILYIYLLARRREIVIAPRVQSLFPSPSSSSYIFSPACFKPNVGTDTKVLSLFG